MKVKTMQNISPVLVQNPKVFDVRSIEAAPHHRDWLKIGSVDHEAPSAPRMATVMVQLSILHTTHFKFSSSHWNLSCIQIIDEPGFSMSQ